MTEQYYQIQIQGLRERWVIAIDRVKLLSQARLALTELRSLGHTARIAEINILED